MNIKSKRLILISIIILGIVPFILFAGVKYKEFLEEKKIKEAIVADSIRFVKENEIAVQEMERLAQEAELLADSIAQEMGRLNDNIGREAVSKYFPAPSKEENILEQARKKINAQRKYKGKRIFNHNISAFKEGEYIGYEGGMYMNGKQGYGYLFYKLGNHNLYDARYRRINIKISKKNDSTYEGYDKEGNIYSIIIIKDLFD